MLKPYKRLSTFQRAIFTTALFKYFYKIMFVIIDKNFYCISTSLILV
jgi:hypothetical protein